VTDDATEYLRVSEELGRQIVQSFAPASSPEQIRDFRQKSWLHYMRRSIFRETAKGGRYRRREPCAGEKVGESKVIEPLGHDDRGATRWSVECPCGKLQIRSASSINYALRHARSLLCPECIGELARGRGIYNAAMRTHAAIERVLDGGPVYTAGEIQFMCDMVRADLEAEFGECEEVVALPVWVDPGWWESKRPTYERRETTDEERGYRNVKRREQRKLEAARRPPKPPKPLKPPEERTGISLVDMEMNWLMIMAGENIDPERDFIADEIRNIPKEKDPLWKRALRARGQKI